MALLQIRRATHSFEDPWTSVAGEAHAFLAEATTGGRPRLATQFSVSYDDERLNVRFSGFDDGMRAAKLDRDDSLYEEDVVEIFLAPRARERYFEFEVNPLGTLFDAAVHSPDLDRETMTVDRSWNALGLRAFLRRERHEARLWQFTTVVSLEFRDLDVETPAQGERWSAGFFRIDRGACGAEFSAWVPSLRNPADFHVPEKFGVLEFL